jgi:tetratricopeptide (TPR) repeat protein
MRRKLVGVITGSVLALSTLRAQDAKVVADNLEFSREFYSGVHFSAIAESAPSFGYQRYPDNGPERIQCDAGTFARQHGKPWLRSEDWGESGRPVDQQTARKLDGWVKLVETAFDFAPSEVKLVKKSREGVRVEWIFEARTANQKGAPVRLEFARPLYDKSPNALLHGFEGSLPATGSKTRERVKFSFGYLIAANGFELSEAAWENLETPKELENKPTDLTKVDMGAKPNDAEGFLNRAGARGFNGDRNGAIADLSRAIDLDPKSEQAVYRRGAFKLQKGDYDGAITDLSRAIELSPNTADYYSDRGLAKLNKHDNDGAIVDFTRATELDAKNAIAYRNRALAKSIKGDADGALADYNHAIELDPKSAGAFNSRGMIKKSKGDLDGAIADFSSAIEINPKLAVAYKNRGEARQTKGDAAGAKEDLKRAGELNPELISKESPSPTAGPRSGGLESAVTESASPAADESDGDLVNRGIEKAKNGDLDGAIADFNRAIELNPKDDAPYYNRAQAKRLKKDTAGAVADYTKAIELGSTNPAAYNNRGNARAENKDRDGAIADYTRAIELKPDYARAYYNRAVMKKAKGDITGAKEDFKMAHKLEPELASEDAAADSSGNRAAGNGGAAETTVRLLDGKLQLDIPSDFSRDPDDTKKPKTLAKFSGPDGAWGTVLRGTHGLTPDELEGYLKMRVAGYNKGFKWLPKDSHLQWLKKEIVTIDGRKWADWSFVPILKGKKDYAHNPVYTRNLTTSYKGQLLEINFTSNLNTSPELKKEIDHIMDSMHLEE